MKLVRQYINEKFVEDSDPVSDLSIGIIQFWKEQHKIIAKKTSKESSMIYFGTEIYDDDALVVYVFLEELCKNIDRHEEINTHKIYLDVINRIKRWQDNNFIKKIDFDKVIYALKKFFYIDVNDTELQIKESLNEKFTEDSDPIEDLNIGIIKEIKDFYNNTRFRNIPYDNWLALEVCIENDKYEYIKFFIESEYVPKEVKLLGLRTAIYNNKYRIVKVFLDAGYKVKYALSKEHVVDLRRFRYDILSSKIRNLIDDAFPPRSDESINEKFTEDSDHIINLGIGMMHEIREYCKDKKLINEEYPCNEIDRLLIICIDNKKYKYVKYLLENGANPNTSAGIHSYDRGLPLRYAAFENSLKLVKLLLRYGASVKLAFDDVNDLKTSYVMQKMNNIKIRELLIDEFYK